MTTDASPTGGRLRSSVDVLVVSLRLGLTSFGGPIAHLGYFRREYVERRAWIDEHSYADLLALRQFLPGPASSQLGIAIGTRLAGTLGGLVAWLGFTLPSAIALVLLGRSRPCTESSRDR
jgi:chromate transporter